MSEEDDDNVMNAKFKMLSNSSAVNSAHLWVFLAAR